MEKKPILVLGGVGMLSNKTATVLGNKEHKVAVISTPAQVSDSKLYRFEYECDGGEYFPKPRRQKTYSKVPPKNLKK